MTVKEESQAMKLIAVVLVILFFLFICFYKSPVGPKNANGPGSPQDQTIYETGGRTW